MESRRQIQGYRVTVANTVCDLGHGQDVGIRWGLVRVSTGALPWSQPGSSMAGEGAPWELSAQGTCRSYLHSQETCCQPLRAQERCACGTRGADVPN